MQRNFLNTIQKILPENSLPLPRNLPCLLKIRIHLTSHGFSHYRISSDFDIKLDGYTEICLDFWLTMKLKRFWFGEDMIIDVISGWSNFVFFFRKSQ